ncbi:MAG: GNAT family N-acetyltransferase [Gemmatimonadaceae bacterium]
MAVRPNAQARGLGVRLLHIVEAFASVHQFRRLVLSTTPVLLRAIELYERHGFRQNGEESSLHGTRLLTMVKEMPV